MAGTQSVQRKPIDCGALKSQRRETINQLVSQLSTGSLSGPSSSSSTDPSVSFNFVCPVPRGAQHSSTSHDQPPGLGNPQHAGVQPNQLESSSQQLSLWANKRDSGNEPAASSSSQGGSKPSGRPSHTTRNSAQSSRAAAAGSAWRAATAMPARDSFFSGANSPTFEPYRHRKPSPRAHQSGQMSVHTAGSRMDLPARASSRLHSNAHLSPVNTSSSRSSSMLYSHPSSVRSLRTRNHRDRRGQSQARPMQRHAHAVQQSSYKQRTGQPRLPAPSGAVRTAKPTPPARAVDESRGNDADPTAQMQELSRLLQQVILLHMAEGGPLAAAGTLSTCRRRGSFSVAAPLQYWCPLLLVGTVV